MQHSAKYLIHADIRTSGVVERSDVVGAVFGQTEGLLGDELDLRGLQESSKIGRIDVDIESEDGRSFGTVTVASGLDRVRTAVLAAALETIERVGPCRADCTVSHIEDARAAKRRELVDRATDLLADLEGSTMTSESLVDTVRQQARVEDITEFEGVPAGPRVADSDAIIVVEGRADVRRLLRFGVKNAIAVEGTDIPEAVGQLTSERTTTALLDGDRGGDLILEELAQIGDIDYVAFAPSDQSVEDLDRSAIMSALRKKLPYGQALDADSPREAFAPSGDPSDPGATSPGEDTEGPTVDETGDHLTVRPESDEAVAAPDGSTADATPAGSDGAPTVEEAAPAGTGTGTGTGEAAGSENTDASAQTFRGHLAEVIGDDSGRVRFLTDSFEPIHEGDADDTFDALADADEPPHTVVLDGTVTQRILDVAAQRGVGQVVGADAGEFVKQPTSIRVLTGEDLQLEQ
jgi:DNA primase